MRTNPSFIKRDFEPATTVFALVGLIVSGNFQAADFPQKFYQNLPI